LNWIPFHVLLLPLLCDSHIFYCHYRVTHCNHGTTIWIVNVINDFLSQGSVDWALCYIRIIQEILRWVHSSIEKYKGLRAVQLYVHCSHQSFFHVAGSFVCSIMKKKKRWSHCVIHAKAQKKKPQWSRACPCPETSIFDYIDNHKECLIKLTTVHGWIAFSALSKCPWQEIHFETLSTIASPLTASCLQNEFLLIYTGESQNFFAVTPYNPRLHCRPSRREHTQIHRWWWLTTFTESVSSSFARACGSRRTKGRKRRASGQFTANNDHKSIYCLSHRQSTEWRDTKTMKTNHLHGLFFMFFFVSVVLGGTHQFD
jgi:hypothetical protein